MHIHTSVEMISDRTELRKSIARKSIVRKARKYSKRDIQTVLDQIKPLIQLESTETIPASSLSTEPSVTFETTTSSVQVVPVSSPSTESFTNPEITASSTSVSTEPHYADLLANLFPFDPAYPDTETRLKKRKENKPLQIQEEPLQGPFPWSVPDNSLPSDPLANIDDETITEVITNSRTHRFCTHDCCPIKRPHSADQFDFESPESWIGQPPHEISETIQRSVAFEEEFAASKLCRLTRAWIDTAEYKQHQTDKAFMEACQGTDASREVVEKMLETKERLAAFCRDYETSELGRLSKVFMDTPEYKRDEADKFFLQAWLAIHATRYPTVKQGMF